MKILVVVRGGAVQAVYTDRRGADFRVLDFDIEGGGFIPGEDKLMRIPPDLQQVVGGGREWACLAHDGEPETQWGAVTAMFEAEPETYDPAGFLKEARGG